MEFSADNFVEKFWSCKFLLKNFMGLKDKMLELVREQRFFEV